MENDDSLMVEVLGAGALELILSVALAAFTIIRCRNPWEYLLLAIWMIFISVLLGFSTMSATLWTRNRPLHHLDMILLSIIISIPPLIYDYLVSHTTQFRYSIIALQ